MRQRWPFLKPVLNFIALAIKILDKDRNRPAKRYHVTGYLFKMLININKFAGIEVFYQIVHFFLFDTYCTPIICSKVAQEGKICSRLTAESCYKRQMSLKSCRAQSEQAYPQVSDHSLKWPHQSCLHGKKH